MKKIIIILIMLIGTLYSHIDTFAGAGVCYGLNRDSVECRLYKLEQLEEKLKKEKTEDIKLLKEKNLKLEARLKELKKISENKKKIEVEKKKAELLKEKIKLEELKEKEKQEKLLKQRKEGAISYLEKADNDLKDLDIKRAISYYKMSCNSHKSYECYYGLGLANFELSKKYFKDIKYYGYKDLFNKAKKEAIKNLNLSLEFTDNEEKIENINKLIIEINNFPNKKKEIIKIENNIKKTETIKEVKEDKKSKIDKKIDLIFIKLDKITKDFTKDKKLKLYKKLVLKLGRYSKKSNNKILEEIINKLILRLEEKINEK